MSQNGCKGYQLSNGDSIDLYDSLNIQKLKKVFVDLDEADSLNRKYERDIAEHIEYEKGLKSEVEICEQKNMEKDGINKEKTEQNILLTQENKILKEKNVFLKKIGKWCAFGGAVIGSGVTYYLTRKLSTR